MLNIEIKAKCCNLNEIELRAKEISDNGEKTVIIQTDTFFNILNSANNGRLKLRQYENGSGMLIYYERPDREGPKLSKYSKTFLTSESFQQLYDILSSSNGKIGEVKKIRHLYMLGQTRIHIDRVSNLGDYVELEVAIPSENEIESGKAICNDIMKKLSLKKEDCISGAYFDLLLNK